MIAIKGMTMSKDSEGCISCAFHWNGDSTTYCLAQSHPYEPAGKRLHHINYDDPNNPYGGEEGLTQEEVYKNCITWRESTCPLVEVEPQESDIEKRKPCINYEDGCEEWAGCPCVHYKVESEE